MGKNKRERQREAQAKAAKTKMKKIISLCVAFVMVIGIGVVLLQGGETEVYGQGISINKSEVIENGYMLYPYKIEGKNLEVIAVRDSNGDVKTAFNTCQICYSSGRGYYEVEGTNLVCNNCGNVYTFDQVEKEQGGCNPVPIMANDKTETSESITITDDLIRENVTLFKTWSK